MYGMERDERGKLNWGRLKKGRAKVMKKNGEIRKHEGGKKRKDGIFIEQWRRERDRVGEIKENRNKIWEGIITHTPTHIQKKYIRGTQNMWWKLINHVYIELFYYFLLNWWDIISVPLNAVKVGKEKDFPFFRIRFEMVLNWELHNICLLLRKSWTIIVKASI